MTYKEIKTILNTYIKYSNKRCGRVNDYHYNELEVFINLRDLNYNQMASHSEIIKIVKRQLNYNLQALNDYTNSEIEQPEFYIYKGHCEALNALLHSLKGGIIKS